MKGSTRNRMKPPSWSFRHTAKGYEAHLFRQDIDQYLTYTAIHHGATVKYNTKRQERRDERQGVTIKTDKGETIRAKFIADASGGGHVLSRMWNLRDNPPRVRLQTRCLFTHMIDVKPYDDLKLPYGVPKAPRRWYGHLPSYVRRRLVVGHPVRQSRRVHK
jgi:FADH2 O2-dependent halogenase